VETDSCGAENSSGADNTFGFVNSGCFGIDGGDGSGKSTDSTSGVANVDGIVHVIKGKRGLSAFPHTKLEEELIKNGIETIALAG
jgi:hypothetical protein